VHVAVPNEDLAFLDHEIGRLELVRQLEGACLGVRLLRIEAQHPAVHLVEQEHLVAFARIDRLRAGNLGVFTGVDHPDGVGADAAVEAAQDGIVGREGNGRNDHAQRSQDADELSRHHRDRMIRVNAQSRSRAAMCEGHVHDRLFRPHQICLDLSSCRCDRHHHSGK
jgi:hypothetical protein